MVEKFLVDLFQRVKKNEIAIILSGDFVDRQVLEFLPKLRSKLKDVGDVKVATVIYADSLPKDHFEPLQNSGFSHKIVHSYEDLYYLIEVYHLYLKGEFDMIILGTNSEQLLPLFTEIRQKATVYGLTNNNVPVSIEESLDGMIHIENIDDFEFETQVLPEFALENGSNLGSSQEINTIDTTNIGTTSSRMESYDEEVIVEDGNE